MEVEALVHLLMDFGIIDDFLINRGKLVGLLIKGKEYGTMAYWTF